MRIIAGRFRRRRLLANAGLTTRPITDFVKESLFARLEESLVGQRVADIFAGTGTIGLEALSRGAASVAFLEKDPKAIELLKRNVASLGDEAQAACLCWNADIFRCSFRPKGDSAKFVPFDWLFFDPPFAMIPELGPRSELFRVLKQLAREDVSSSNARLVLRTPDQSQFVMPVVWELEHHWPFSHMEIFVYRKARSIEPADAALDVGLANAPTNPAGTVPQPTKEPQETER
jgi:16S rRNA (guanine966-N2)-methyltransferase